MAKVIFFGAKLPFAQIRKLYKDTLQDPDQFAALIFQNEIDDTSKKDNEYILICYPVDNKGKVTNGQSKISLIKDANKNSEKAKKVNLANLPLSREKIKDLIDLDPSGQLIDHLHFTPKPYPVVTKPDDPYIAYNYEAHDANGQIAIKGFVGGDINPSPPAPPGN
jgi:hypothetical protein